MSTLAPRTMYVIYTLDGGGAERLLTNILLQQNTPDRVRVVTLRPGGVFRPVLEEAGIEVLDLGMSRYQHAPSGIARLARLIRKHQPEVVHGWDYFANLLVLFARFFAGSFCFLKLQFCRIGSGDKFDCECAASGK